MFACYFIHNPRSKCIGSIKEEMKQKALQNKKPKKKQQNHYTDTGLSCISEWYIRKNVLKHYAFDL